MHGGMKTATATMTDRMIASVTVLPRLRSAPEGLPSPMRSAASALPPLPMRSEMARNTVMMGIATVAVERPISPIACPRKMESITLYAPLTSIPKMEGTANSVIRRGMDSVPMRITFWCWPSPPEAAGAPSPAARVLAFFDSTASTVVEEPDSR